MITMFLENLGTLVPHHLEQTVYLLEIRLYSDVPGESENINLIVNYHVVNKLR